MSEPLTRAEMIDGRIFDALSAVKDLVTLIEITPPEDRGDQHDLLVSIFEIKTALAEAAKPIERDLTKTDGYEKTRRRDHVVVTQSSTSEKPRPKGGDWTPLRHAIIEAALDEFVGPADSLGERAAVNLTDAVRHVDASINKVFTTPPSKPPSKPQMKKLGLKPEDWIVEELTGKSECKVWPVEMYETIIGPAPAPEIVVAAGSEPF